MSELEPPQEPNNQEPFIIRAHHLVVFRSLLQRSSHEAILYNLDPVLSPKELAERLRSTVENHKSKYPEIKYPIDVLGSSSETASIFTQQIQKIFETFLSLPDNHPVEITEGVQDDICKACIIGEHCRINYRKGKGYGLDSKHLDAFVRGINFIYSRKPSIAKEKIYFLDLEKPQKVRRTRTTMGIVKNILATRPFEVSDVHSSFWSF